MRIGAFEKLKKEYRLYKYYCDAGFSDSKIAERKNRVKCLQTEAEKIIKQVDDERLALLLTLKFLPPFHTMDEIAEIMNYSERHVRRLLQKALSYIG